MKKVPESLLVDLYKKHNSVWKVGKIVGLCGQSVHERLSKINVVNKINVLTNGEKEKIKAVYLSGILRGDNKLKNLSKEINRTIHFISRYARSVGLTSYNRGGNDSFSLKISARSKEWHKHNPHPKGFLGGKHTKKSLEKIAEASKNSWQKMTDQAKEKRTNKILDSRMKNGNWCSHMKSHNAYSRTKSGKREDLDNIFFRSSAEANYARYLKFFKIDFKYEFKTFYFEGIKRGTVSYTPDFYIPEEDRYIEFKGWLDKKSITRLKRFRRYYPKEFDAMQIVKQTLSKKHFGELCEIGFLPHQIIDFKTVTKMAAVIPGWE